MKLTRRQLPGALAGAAWAASLQPSGTRAVAEYDEVARRFTIGNSRFQKRLRITPEGGLELEFLGLTGGRNWARPASRWSAGFHVRTAGRPGAAEPTFLFGLADPRRVRLARHAVRGDPAGSMELELVFEEVDRGLEFRLHLRAFADADVIEQWLEVHNAGREKFIGLERFDPLLVPLAVAPAETCRITYVQGERARSGRGAENIQPYGPYHVGRCDLFAGQAFTMSTRQDRLSRRLPTSTAEYLNWFALEVPPGGDGLCGGLQWSGHWLIHFARRRDEVILQAGIDDFRRDLAPGETVVSPRVFYGCYRGDTDAGVRLLHRYLRAHVMPSDPDGEFPWTHYNTWYNWNILLREEALREEAKLAAGLGLECFYLDAGWYEGSPTERASFGLGLGTWRENREKFPSGIAAFADYIHSLGMKFGVWVEPERVDLRFVDQAGSPIRGSWLALADPARPPAPGGTNPLCFGNPEVVAWAKQTLSRLIAEYKVDWLKWDHNVYTVCTRADHGHQAGDGNFAHIQGVYEVMGHLRRQFPRLALENCSGGGHRTDFGILRFASTAWNSDATSPGYRVRYQVTGASYAFPAQYLNAWFIDNDEEPATGATPAARLDEYLRSRMYGAFGISGRLASWPENLRAAARRAVELYKKIRPVLRRGDVYHLLPQTELFVPPMVAPAEWDAIEYFAPELGAGVVLAFRAASPAESVTLPVRGLEPRTRYRIRWHDGGRVEVRTGAEWARRGATVLLKEPQTSEILWIERL